MERHDAAGPTIGREIEHKLRVAVAFELPDLEREVHGLVVGPPTVETLLATYHDTPDLRLVRNGATLRFRRSAGRGTWTLKVDDPLSRRRDGSLDRREIESPGSRTRVPSGLLSALAPFIGLGSVSPVAVLRTERTKRLLTVDGVPVATLVDDRVTVEESPGGRDGFRELEVELVDDADRGSDSDAVVHEIVGALLAAGAKEDRGVPKLHRALGDALPLPVVLGRRSTLGDLVCFATQRALRDLVLHEVGLVTRREVEDVHGARVATRRLRSDLGTLGAAIDPAWASDTRAELRHLAGALGAVRDLDVLHDRFARDLEASGRPASGAGAALLARLDEQRAAHLEQLLVEVTSTAHGELLERLHRAAAEVPEGPSAHRPLRKAAEEILETSVRRLHRAARKADHGAADDELHAVRILAKRCRYAAELVRPVLPRARRIGRVAREAQAVLGELNDASTARAWLEEVAPSLDGPQAFLAGVLAAAEIERASASRRAWPEARRRVRDLRER